MPRLVLAFLIALASVATARTFEAPEAADGFVPRLVVKLSPSSEPARERVARLAAQSGVALAHVRTLGVGAELVASPAIATIAQADALAARLAALPGVAYAERTHRVRAMRVPDDPQFPLQGYLMPGAASIDATSAWDMTVGSPAIVVAVLDTGSTPHEDLAGRTLPGYDFVSLPQLSNDASPPDAQGSYRDADPSDPGDWVSPADLTGLLLEKECIVRSSSWHGTSVMGVIGAATDNGRYLAGVDWRARLVPVRVLGKCYGEDADVADAIVWAAGVAVPGAPVNTSPAHVINMSLGDPGACPRFMQDAVDVAFAHGVTRAIVAAAGNENDGGDHFPSACAGVISVAATTGAGSKTSYSNFGPRVDLAAPGGNSGNFLTLWNAGETVPAADSLAQRQGTSFSAPLVSGVASLALSVAPGLSAEHLRALLKASAKPFPSSSSCATLGCGTGIVDAAAAVKAARATTGGTLRTTVVEYYNASLDHYFLTWASDEILLLDAGTASKGWARTGYSFEVLHTPAPDTAPVCRIYIPPGFGDGHYFGRDAAECAGTLAAHPAFVAEDPAFFYLYTPVAGACPASTRPVYRVYSNRIDANHRYTTSRDVRDAMVARGWLAEGDGADRVVMCAPAIS